jgi:hypothetical protein
MTCMRIRTGVKWTATILCLVIAAAFLVSTRREIEWRSPGLRYTAGILPGEFYVGWRPNGWSLNSDRSAGWPGWTVAKYVWQPGIAWRPYYGPGSTMHVLEIPLWMPGALFAIPAGLLWCLDRRRTRAVLERFVDWFTPRHRLRVTFLRWLAAAILHFGFVWLAADLFWQLCDFFFGQPMPSSLDQAFKLTVRPLVYGTPLFGILWAWLWVRLRNHLWRTRRGNRCFECGYDLTGNLSGRCPECGTPCAAVLAA